MSLTLKRAQELFDVDFEAGELYWRINLNKHNLIGCRAGWTNSEGYRKIKVGGTEYFACKIIWLLYYEVYPEHIVDHEDRNRWNDSIGNLRKANSTQNVVNGNLRFDNTSGYRGVSKQGDKWRAYYSINGAYQHIGTYNTAKEAQQAYFNIASTVYGKEFVVNDAPATSP